MRLHETDKQTDRQTDRQDNAPFFFSLDKVSDGEFVYLSLHLVKEW